MCLALPGAWYDAQILLEEGDYSSLFEAMVLPYGGNGDSCLSRVAAELKSNEEHVRPSSTP